MARKSFTTLIKFYAVSRGIGDFVVNTALPGCVTPEQANVTDGKVYGYFARNVAGDIWEGGDGSYDVASHTLRRVVTANSNGDTSPVDFPVAPEVDVFPSPIPLLEPLVSFFVSPQGRLTLVSGSAIMLATQASKTTLFYTPYLGNGVPLYDGSVMKSTPFAELSASTTDATKSPAAIGASKINDWFVWNDNGTLRLGHGPDWTSDTARSAGTALVKVNGIYLNNVAITNGPAAQRGTYVGSTRSDGSSQLNWIIPSTGTAGDFAMFNAYNRVLVVGSAAENTNNWVYSLTTVRSSNATAISRINFLMGLAEDSVQVMAMQNVNTPNVGGAFCKLGFALDSTTDFDRVSDPSSPGGTLSTDHNVQFSYSPMLGYHYVSQNEAGDGTNNTLFLGQARMALTLSTRM
jgi:hypothetical protein